MDNRGLWLVSALLFIACGSSSSGDKSTSPPQPAATCASLAPKVAAVMVDDIPDLETDTRATVVQAAVDGTTTSCTEDAWSTAAIECYDDVTGTTFDTCAALLTEPQNAQFQARLQESILTAITGAPAGFGQGHGSAGGAGQSTGAAPNKSDDDDDEGGAPRGEGADPDDGGE